MLVVVVGVRNRTQQKRKMENKKQEARSSYAPPAMELTPLSTSAPTLRSEKDVLGLRVLGLRGDDGGDVGDEGVRRWDPDADAGEDGKTGDESARVAAVARLGLCPCVGRVLLLPEEEEMRERDGRSRGECVDADGGGGEDAVWMLGNASVVVVSESSIAFGFVVIVVVVVVVMGGGRWKGEQQQQQTRIQSKGGGTLRAAAGTFAVGKQKKTAVHRV